MKKKNYSMYQGMTPGEKELALKRQKEMSKEAAERPLVMQGPTIRPVKVKKLRMFGDRVLIKQEQAPETIKGIIDPNADKRKPARGLVVAVGPKCAEAVVGEDVSFGKYAGTAITLRENEQFQYKGVIIQLNPGQDLLILREVDVFLSETDV